MAELLFELVSPERLLLSEKVTSVLVPGDAGEFEVFGGHAPFMTTLRPGFVVVKGGSKAERRIFVNGGFADVSARGFTLLAEEAIPSEEIDREAILAQVRDAEEDLSDAKSPADRDEAERRLQHLRDVQVALGYR